MSHVIFAQQLQIKLYNFSNISLRQTMARSIGQSIKRIYDISCAFCFLYSNSSSISTTYRISKFNSLYRQYSHKTSHKCRQSYFPSSGRRGGKIKRSEGKDCWPATLSLLNNIFASQWRIFVRLIEIQLTYYFFLMNTDNGH